VGRRIPNAGASSSPMLSAMLSARFPELTRMMRRNATICLQRTLFAPGCRTHTQKSSVGLLSNAAVASSPLNSATLSARFPEKTSLMRENATVWHALQWKNSSGSGAVTRNGQEGVKLSSLGSA